MFCFDPEWRQFLWIKQCDVFSASAICPALPRQYLRGSRDYRQLSCIQFQKGTGSNREKSHYDNIYSTIICWNYISFRIHLSYWFITREDTTERNDFLYFILLLKYIQKCTINTPIHVSVIVYKNPLKSLFILSQIVSFETPIKIYELNQIGSSILLNWPLNGPQTDAG